MIAMLLGSTVSLSYTYFDGIITKKKEKKNCIICVKFSNAITKLDHSNQDLTVNPASVCTLLHKLRGSDLPDCTNVAAISETFWSRIKSKHQIGNSDNAKRQAVASIEKQFGSEKRTVSFGYHSNYLNENKINLYFNTALITTSGSGWDHYSDLNFKKTTTYRALQNLVI